VQQNLPVHFSWPLLGDLSLIQDDQELLSMFRLVFGGTQARCTVKMLRLESVMLVLKKKKSLKNQLSEDFNKKTDNFVLSMTFTHKNIELKILVNYEAVEILKLRAKNFRRI
jgi:hypothetical protein